MPKRSRKPTTVIRIPTDSYTRIIRIIDLVEGQRGISSDRHMTVGDFIETVIDRLSSDDIDQLASPAKNLAETPDDPSKARLLESSSAFSDLLRSVIESGGDVGDPHLTVLRRKLQELDEDISGLATTAGNWSSFYSRWHESRNAGMDVLLHMLTGILKRTKSEEKSFTLDHYRGAYLHYRMALFAARTSSISNGRIDLPKLLERSRTNLAHGKDESLWSDLVNTNKGLDLFVGYDTGKRRVAPGLSNWMSTSISRLAEGVIEAQGSTRSRRYVLRVSSFEELGAEWPVEKSDSQISRARELANKVEPDPRRLSFTEYWEPRIDPYIRKALIGR